MLQHLPISTGINKRNGIVKKNNINHISIIIIKVCLSYLFQIYTATPLVFTYMYKVFISALIKYLEWRCCEIELSKCTLASL